MMQLTREQYSIHERALEVSSEYLSKEASLIDILAEVERTLLFRKLNCSSMHMYAVEILSLSPAISYALIAIARKSREVPELKSIPVAKASRIVSIVTKENAAELLRFARTHTQREIEFEVARRNPQAASRDRVKPLEAQRTGRSPGFAQAFEAAMDQYLNHADPVQKAARAKARGQKKEENFCARRVDNEKSADSTRVKLSARQKHAVFERDGGRCTHVNDQGKRCDSDRWIEVHHIRPVNRGGGNEPENLTTLCSFHHDLVHQLSLPVDGQVSRLREPVTLYG